MGQIKYCVWDVGKTIYDYSLAPLDKLFRENTKDIKAYEEKGGVFKYDYDPYMKGDVTHGSFCQDLCKTYGVEFSDKIKAKINKALHEGVGEYYPETKRAMQTMKQAGIKNCILSNALPILADTGRTDGLVEKNNVFCSFSLGLLKPNPDIYRYVSVLLDAEPNEILFIDDKSRNTEAAKKVGFNTITYNRETIEKDIAKYLPQNNIAMLTQIKNKKSR